MKKLIAIILATVMVLAMAMTAAAAEAPALDGSWPEETVKIGFAVYDTTDEQLLAIQDYSDYLESKLNIEFMYSEAIADADAELDFINRCADAGCKGYIGYYNLGLENAINACTERGMYYVGTGDAYEAVKDNPLYLGSYKLAAQVNGEDVNGDYYGGYLLGKALAEGGYNHIMYCNGGAAFVQFFKDRQDGFLQGLLDGGYDKFDPSTDTLEGFPDGEAWFAGQAQMLAQDFDAVASSFNIALFFQAEGERLASGQEPFAMAAIGEVNDTYKDFMEMGCIKAIVYDCEEVVFGCFAAMLLNAILGNPEMCKNEDGTAIWLPVQRWLVTSPEEFSAIYDFHDGGNYYVSAEELVSVVKAYNPDATQEEMFALYDQTLEEALAK